MNILIASVLSGAVLAGGFWWQSRRARWTSRQEPVVKRFVPAQTLAGTTSNFSGSTTQSVKPESDFPSESGTGMADSIMIGIEEPDEVMLDEVVLDEVVSDAMKEPLRKEQKLNILPLDDRTEGVTYLTLKPPTVWQRIIGWGRLLVAWGVQLFDRSGNRS